MEDKLFIVKNSSGVRVKVLAPNAAVARFIAKYGVFSHAKDKLQVIKARKRKG